MVIGGSGGWGVIQEIGRLSTLYSDSHSITQHTQVTLDPVVSGQQQSLQDDCDAEVMARVMAGCGGGGVGKVAPPVGSVDVDMNGKGLHQRPQARDQPSDHPHTQDASPLVRIGKIVWLDKQGFFQQRDQIHRELRMQ